MRVLPPSNTASTRGCDWGPCGEFSSWWFESTRAHWRGPAPSPYPGGAIQRSSPSRHPEARRGRSGRIGASSRRKRSCREPAMGRLELVRGDNVTDRPEDTCLPRDAEVS